MRPAGTAPATGMTPGASAAGRWPRAERAGLRFRAATEADLPFLFRLYASTRWDELAPLPWPEAQKAAFLDMQARAQHTDYGRNFPGAERWVIGHAGQDIGRLYLDHRQGAHHILDVALLPEARNKGWGGALLADLIDEAAGAGKAVTIHVESMNPARRLYDRLGFRPVEERPPYLMLRRDLVVS